MARVFFSYSHKDEALRDELEAHLALLKNQGLIEVWHDRRIAAGSVLDESIDKEMEAADVILLLVSSDFLASWYCYSKEMTRAMQRHEAKEARVIPVILRACDWSSATFGKLLAAPKDGRPVNSWPDKDEAFADVAKQVRIAVQGQSNAAIAPIAATLRPRSEAYAVSMNSLPRSSNLRLAKKFTEQDRNSFLRDAYDFVSKFFNGSLNALKERNPEVTFTFDQIDTRRFSAVVYMHGKTASECSIRLDSLGGRSSNGIAFSHDASARSGSFNEMLNVEATEQALFLKPLGMAWSGNKEQHLSAEGAAEFLWDLFVSRLQN